MDYMTNEQAIQQDALRVCVVLGTRPELIKMSSTIRAMRLRVDVETSVVFTGQHDELMRSAAQDLGIDADYQIAPLDRGRSLTDVVSTIIAELGTIVGRTTRFDCIVIQGDTASALAGALVAELTDTPLVHVEAGVRSKRRDDPFPEETIRRMISPISEFHIAFTETAMNNLLEEGVPRTSITISRHPLRDHIIVNAHNECLSKPPESLLMTIHRRERRRGRLETLLRVLQQPGIDATRAIFVWHPSLDVDVREFRAKLERLGVRVVDPMSPSAFLRELVKAAVVITDSAGVSEEAEMMGIPVVAFRKSAEIRLEGLTGEFAISTEDHLTAAAFILQYQGSIRPKSPHQTDNIRAGSEIANIIVEQANKYRTIGVVH